MHIDDFSQRTYTSGAPWDRVFHERYPRVITRAVGWLGKTVTTTGSVPADLLEAVRFFRVRQYCEDFTMGTHRCEVCSQIYSHGEFWILWSGYRYVAPAMLEHYITAHSYLPPSEFIEHAIAAWRACRELPEKEFEFSPQKQIDMARAAFGNTSAG